MIYVHSTKQLDGEKPEIATGDWVRFYYSARLVIGAVEYISLSTAGNIQLHTDIGTVQYDAVMDWRSKI